MNLPSDSLFPQPFHDERDAATVGVVEAVSSNNIEVGIVREAPHGTGLWEGILQRFPRINSYLVIPAEHGGVLALVVWVGIDTNRISEEDQVSDLIGMPTPRRRLRAIPLGLLRYGGPGSSAVRSSVSLDRGALVFPTVGDPVRLPTPAELKAVVPGSSEHKLTVPVGHAILAADARVELDPNRLFGRHLAVLGNTGSGKSCSLAHLLRASASSVSSISGFNAVILDLNGEYRDVFDDLPDGIRVRRFTVQPDDFDSHSDSAQLRVPYWLWNYQEWLSFSEASARAQAPQLRRCLHLLRTTDIATLPVGIVQLVGGRSIIRRYIAGSVDSKVNSYYLSELDNSIVACKRLAAEGHQSTSLDELRLTLNTILKGRRDNRPGYIWKYNAPSLTVDESSKLIKFFDRAITEIGVPESDPSFASVDDSPIPFDGQQVLELLPLVAEDADASNWIAPMIERLRISMSDHRQELISGWRLEEDLEKWLQDYIPDNSSNQVTIIDLSLVPPHVLHVLVGVFARVLIEAMERYHRLTHGNTVPRLLVVDEAHAVMSKRTGAVSDDKVVVPARLCREAFERIAREGRKFGLSLIVSSQRPNELSETVLSQCNTFLIHRIVNDHDQRYVRRLMPDSLGGLVEELPALPSQTALLVGWALDVPTLVRIDDLDPRYQPRSADPDFVALWRGDSRPDERWESVVRDWTSDGRLPPDAQQGD